VPQSMDPIIVLY